MLTDNIDEVFLINLNERPDRLIKAQSELAKHNIDFVRFVAWKDSDGALALRMTMVDLFKKAIESKMKHILVLEDDVKFTTNPIQFINKSFQQLPKTYSALFLGGNVFKPFKCQYSENLYELTGCVANHAVIYNIELLGQKLLNLYGTQSKPIDLILNDNFVSYGNCFITNPLLAIQRPEYSDIENRNVNYNRLLIDRYNKYKKLCR